MKKHFLLIWLLVCLLMFPASGLAEDGCFLINVDALDMTRLNQNDYVQYYLSSQAQGLRVTKQIPGADAQPVRLSLVEMIGQTLIFDKDYGYQSGTFDSGSLYLPYLGGGTVPYLVTLYVGDMVYAMPFMQLQARLYANGACTYGAHLYDFSPALGQDWLMGTMLDLNALRAQGYMAVDVCASNRYLIGQADIYYHDGRISVTLSLNPAANADIQSLSIYVSTDCASLGNAAQGAAYSQGEWIPVGDAPSALLFMPMTISYDPAGLSTFGYDLSHGYLQQQLRLWQENQAGM